MCNHRLSCVILSIVFVGIFSLLCCLNISIAQEEKRIPDIFSGGEEAPFDKRTDKWFGGKTPLGYIFNNFDKIELGDDVYGRFTKPGLPYPFELSKEEREKLTPDQVMRRWIEGVGYKAFAKNYEGSIRFLTLDRRGHLREKIGKEYHVSYINKPESKERKEGVMNKFIFKVVAPEDARGLSTMTWRYFDDDKSDDIWIFLTSLRKVRRMSDASKQDSFLGTDHHYDDISLKIPIYNYKFLKSEVFQVKDDDIFGLEKENLKRFINGVGRECWVIEATPKKSWYFAKRISWQDKENYIEYKQLKYDKKGRLIITRASEVSLVQEAPNTSGAKDYYIIFSFAPVETVLNNHLTWGNIFTGNWDTDLPESIFSTRYMLTGVY